MKNFVLKKPLSKNQLDDLTDGLVNAMRYSDSSVEYPSFDNAKPDEGVDPDKFLEVYNGDNDFSEMNAIYQYISQEAMFEDVGELMMGVALTEMKHLDKLADFIHKVGGETIGHWNNKDVSFGTSAKEAVEFAISAEKKTIAYYTNLKLELLETEETETVRIALQLLSKLIADEKVHLKLFTDMNKTLGGDNG